jgi:hypothetical protein
MYLLQAVLFFMIEVLLNQDRKKIALSNPVFHFNGVIPFYKGINALSFLTIHPRANSFGIASPA